MAHGRSEKIEERSESNATENGSWKGPDMAYTD